MISTAYPPIESAESTWAAILRVFTGSYLAVHAPAATPSRKARFVPMAALRSPDAGPIPRGSRGDHLLDRGADPAGRHRDRPCDDRTAGLRPADGRGGHLRRHGD